MDVASLLAAAKDARAGNGSVDAIFAAAKSGASGQGSEEALLKAARTGDAEHVKVIDRRATWRDPPAPSFDWPAVFVRARVCMPSTAGQPGPRRQGSMRRGWNRGFFFFFFFPGFSLVHLALPAPSCARSFEDTMKFSLSEDGAACRTHEECSQIREERAVQVSCDSRVGMLGGAR